MPSLRAYRTVMTIMPCVPAVEHLERGTTGDAGGFLPGAGCALRRIFVLPVATRPRLGILELTVCVWNTVLLPGDRCVSYTWALTITYRLPHIAYVAVKHSSFDTSVCDAVLRGL